jgi:hypothetical protein
MPGLCLSTGSDIGGNQLQATPCGMRPPNPTQRWNLSSSSGGGELVVAAGPAAGFCAAACAHPPPDPDSFCPRYHPIRGPNVYRLRVIIIRIRQNSGLPEIYVATFCDTDSDSDSDTDTSDAEQLRCVRAAV